MKNLQKIKREKRLRRHRRVRAKIAGTAERPRLSIYKSSKHIYVQLIDDQTAHTLAEADDLEVKDRKSQSITKTGQKLKGKAAIAYQVGKLIAEKALKKKIKQAVFDRGGYKYQGRVKALAEGVREGGLQF